MKKLFLILLLTASASTAFSQDKQAADTSRTKEDIGTTAYGLPVHKSYVPEDAAERAKKKYGRALYSIEKTAAENCQNSYLVGLIRNGKLTVEFMCDDPKMVRHSNRPASAAIAKL